MQNDPTQEKRELLYNAIEKSGKFKLGDRTWFNEVLDDEERSMKLYQALESSGDFKLPAPEVWAEKFGKKKDQTDSEGSQPPSEDPSEDSETGSTGPSNYPLSEEELQANLQKQLKKRDEKGTVGFGSNIGMTQAQKQEEPGEEPISKQEYIEQQSKRIDEVAEEKGIDRGTLLQGRKDKQAHKFLSDSDKESYFKSRELVETVKAIKDLPSMGYDKEDIKAKSKELVEHAERLQKEITANKLKRDAELTSQILAKEAELAKYNENTIYTEDRDQIVRDIAQLKRQKAYAFKTTEEAVETLVKEGKIERDDEKTAQEQFNDYYQAVFQEYSDVVKRIENQSGIAKALNIVKQTIFGDDDLERSAELGMELETMAPVALVNRNPYTDTSQKENGFLRFAKRVGGEFSDTMSGLEQYYSELEKEQQYLATVFDLGLANQVEQLDVLMKTGNFDPETDQFKDYGLDDLEFWGGMTGTSMALMGQITSGSVLSGMALSRINAGRKLLKIADGSIDLAKHANHGQFIDWLSKSPRMSKVLAKMTLGGIQYETAGMMFRGAEEEATFLGGFLGVGGQTAVEGLLKAGAKKVTPQIMQGFNRLFGENTNKAVQIVKGLGKSFAVGTGRGFGEVGEETSQELAHIFEESNGDFIKILTERYGNLENISKLLVGSFVMGAFMGTGSFVGEAAINNYRKGLAKLKQTDPEQARLVEQIGNDLMKEMDGALEESITEKPEPTYLVDGKVVSVEEMIAAIDKGNTDALYIENDPELEQMLEDKIQDLRENRNYDAVSGHEGNRVKMGDIEGVLTTQEDGTITIVDDAGVEHEVPNSNKQHTKSIKELGIVDLEVDSLAEIAKDIKITEKKLSGKLTRKEQIKAEKKLEWLKTRFKKRTGEEYTPEAGENAIKMNGEKEGDAAGDTSQDVDETAVQGTPEVQAKTKKVVKAVKKAISKILPDIKVEMPTTLDDYNRLMEEAGEEVDPESSGFYDRKNKRVVLNMEKVRGNTAFHEVIHPIVDGVKDQNPELYDSLVKHIDSLDFNGFKYGDWARDNYKGEEVQKNEMVTEFLADFAEAKFDELQKSNPTLFDKIVEAIREIISALDLGPVMEIDLDNTSVEELQEKLGQALAKGEKLSIKASENSAEQTKQGNDAVQENVSQQTNISVKGNEQIKAGKVHQTVRQKYTENKVPKERMSDNFTVDDLFTENTTANDKVIGVAMKLASGEMTYMKQQTNKPSKQVTIPLGFIDTEKVNRMNELKEERSTLKSNKADVARKAEIDAEVIQHAKDIMHEVRDWMEANITALYNSLTPEFIEVSKRWYEGANRIANNLAKDYGVSVEQAAGILAVLSPQNDWFNNISGAERVMEIMTNKRDVPFTKDILTKAIAYAKSVDKKSPWIPVIKKLHKQWDGKTLQEIIDEETFGSKPDGRNYRWGMANLVRAIDFATNDPEVHAFDPEGHVVDYNAKPYGVIMYKGDATVVNALSIFLDGSEKNINDRLGVGNKVRNFYNNIVDPNNKNDYVTADTHALSVAFMQPISADDAGSGAGLFAGGESPMYALVKEAYVNAAQRVGLLGREMQSITWEAQRTGINDKNRQESQKNAIFEQILEFRENKDLSYEQRAEQLIRSNPSSITTWGKQRGIPTQQFQGDVSNDGVGRDSGKGKVLPSGKRGGQYQRDGGTDSEVVLETSKRVSKQSGVKVNPYVDTDNFKKWFGASKIVDENGDPAVYYHGTGANFDTFEQKKNNREWFFASPEAFAADFFTKDVNDPMGKRTMYGGNIMPLYVKAENPFDFENEAHLALIEEEVRRIQTSEIRGDKTLMNGLNETQIQELIDTNVERNMEWIQYPVGGYNWAAIERYAKKAWLEKNGFDSMYVMEDSAKNIAVLSPTQFKSATGNNGRFSPEEASILKQKGDKKNPITFSRDLPDSEAKQKLDNKFSQFGGLAGVDGVVFKAKDGKDYIMYRQPNTGDMFLKVVRADKGSPVGWTRLYENYKEDVLTGYAENQSVYVNPKLRRNGIASAMYDYAEELSGMPVRKSDVLSDDAQAFWNDRTSERVSKQSGVKVNPFVDTDNFKKWFGASKITDENGDPAVYYHGTGADFDVFKSSRYFIFASPGPELANNFARLVRHYDDAAMNIMPLFVRSENPFDYDSDEHMELFNKLVRGIQEKRMIEGNSALTPPQEQTLENFLDEQEQLRLDVVRNLDRRSNWELFEQFITPEWLTENGFDGMFVKEGRQKNIAVLSPNQFKSATGNNGEFSKEEDSILKQKGNKSNPLFNGSKDSKGFDAWKGDAELMTGPEVYEEAQTGRPVVVRAYHGTTHEFNEFDANLKGTKLGHLGKVNYFTTDQSDASMNYQSDGADITIRVQDMAERIEQDLEDNYADQSGELNYRSISEAYDIPLEQIQNIGITATSRAIATGRLKGDTEKVMDLYVKLNNPLVLGNGKKQWVEAVPQEMYEEYMEEAAEEVAADNGMEVEDVLEDYAWEVRARAREMAGVEENPYVTALQDALNDNNGWDDHDAQEYLGEYAYEEEFELNALDEHLRYALAHTMDEEGELSSGQVIADMYRNLGFDGVIVSDPNVRFSGMQIAPMTSHIHVFNDVKGQIKSATDNEGDYDPANNNIYKQKGSKDNPLKKKVSRTTQRIKSSTSPKFDPIKQDAVENPEKHFYDTQSYKIITMDLTNKTKDELRTAMGDLTRIKSEDNTAVLNAAELLNRLAMEIDDHKKTGNTEQQKLAEEEMKTVYHQLIDSGRTIGQLLRQFGEIKAGTPLGIVSMVEHILANHNLSMQNDQRNRLIGLVTRYQRSLATVKEAHARFIEEGSKDNLARLNRVEKIARAEYVNMAEMIAQILPKGISNTIGTIIKGNLLTPISITTNIVANVLYAPFNGYYNTLGNIFETVHELVTTGKTSADITPFLGTIGGFITGIGRGTVDSMRKVPDVGDIQKYDMDYNIRGFQTLAEFFKKNGRENWARNSKGRIPFKIKVEKFMAAFPTMGVSSDIMFRSLLFGDKPFRNAAETSATLQEAAKAGVKIGITDYAKFKQFERTMNAKQRAAVKLAGDRATFSDERTLARVAKAVHDLPNKSGNPLVKHVGKFVANLAMPYRTVPSNLVQELIELALPVIPAAMAVKHGINGNSKEMGRNLAKASLGYMLYVAGRSLAENGAIMGSGVDDDENERALDNQAGMPNGYNWSAITRAMNGVEDPWTQRPDDQWMSLMKLGVPGMYMSWAAGLHESIREDELDTKDMVDWGIEVVPRMFTQIGRAALDQSFLQGAMTSLDALTGANPRAWTDLIGTASVIGVPNTFTSAFVRPERMYIVSDKANSPTQQLINKLDIRVYPEGGESLPKITLFGDVIRQTPKDHNAFLYHNINVFKPRYVDNPIVIEIAKLSKKYNDYSLLTFPSESITIQDYELDEESGIREPIRVKLDDRDRMRVQMYAGSFKRLKFEEQMSKPEWAKRPDKVKAEILRDINRTANTEMLDYIKGNIVKGVKDGTIKIVDNEYFYIGRDRAKPLGDSIHDKEMFRRNPAFAGEDPNDL